MVDSQQNILKTCYQIKSLRIHFVYPFLGLISWFKEMLLWTYIVFEHIQPLKHVVRLSAVPLHGTRIRVDWNLLDKELMGQNQTKKYEEKNLQNFIGQNSWTQFATKLKKSNCDKTTWILTKPKNSNSEKLQQKNQIVIKL